METTLLSAQKAFFATHRTKDIDFRIENLKRLKKALKTFEEPLLEALWKDLHKSSREAYLTEMGILYSEIDNHIKHVRKWAKMGKVPTPLYLFPARSRIVYEPLGVALIIAPWNYPVQLLLSPLTGAISSGCCAVLKPSPYTPSVSAVLQKMIDETFPKEYIALVQGGRDVNTQLLQQRFDFIFYTGSPSVGRVVMKAAAENLTPVVLELGGKSPCIIDKDADIEIAARRIAWGKTVNSGQTCIAPDYAFVHSSIKEKLISQMIIEIEKMLGKDIKSSEYFPRMVNEKAFDRVERLLHQGTVRYGGESDKSQLYISPTIIDDIKPDYLIMQEEIFGPVLPVMTFESIEEPLEYIASHEKPLAFYFFGSDKGAKEVILKSTSGGACINDTIMHVANDRLPFGGVGNSGLGKYHGRNTFLAFSNLRSVLWNKNIFDMKVRYTPYNPFGLIKKLL